MRDAAGAWAAAIAQALWLVRLGFFLPAETRAKALGVLIGKRAGMLTAAGFAGTPDFMRACAAVEAAAARGALAAVEAAVAVHKMREEEARWAGAVAALETELAAAPARRLAVGDVPPPIAMPAIKLRAPGDDASEYDVGELRLPHTPGTRCPTPHAAHRRTLLIFLRHYG